MYATPDHKEAGRNDAVRLRPGIHLGPGGTSEWESASDRESASD